MAIIQSVSPLMIRVSLRGYSRIHIYNSFHFSSKQVLKRKVFREYSQSSSLADEEKLREIIDSSNLGTLVRKKDSISEENSPESEQSTDFHASNILKPDVEQQKSGIEINSTNRVFQDEEENSKISGNKDIKHTNEKFQDFLANLPSQREKIRGDLSKKIDGYLDWIQQALFKATRTLNDVTGYSSIEKLKREVQILEEQLHNEKEYVKKCKIDYSEAIKNRSVSQKEINELLTRKHNWTPNDLERFTELYRNDHTNELKEQETGKVLEEVENSVEGLQLSLTQSILSRYHEEQIWSDKIRRSSTWGTWILMGINIFLFLLATFIVEPWKRRKLVDSFELKIKEYLQDSGKTTVPLQVISPDSLADNANEAPVTAESHTASSSQESPKSSTNSFHTSGILSFYLLDKSWEGLKALFRSNYNILLSKDCNYLSFQKSDLTILVSVITLSACTIGSLLTLYFT